MNGLIGAIQHYQGDYTFLPASKSLMKAVGSSDYTFGTYRRDGSYDETSNGASTNVHTTYGASFGSTGGSGGSYANCNAEIIDILLGSDTFPDGKTNTLTQFNSRKVQYLNTRMSKGTDVPGVSMDDHVFRDPWGNPYMVTLDLNYNDHVVDLFYGNLARDHGGITNLGSVMVWSFGPDGKADLDIANGARAKDTQNPKGKYENNDNILSWQ
jgi:hypothetical protein